MNSPLSLKPSGQRRGYAYLEYIRAARPPSLKAKTGTPASPKLRTNCRPLGVLLRYTMPIGFLLEKMSFAFIYISTVSDLGRRASPNWLRPLAYACQPHAADKHTTVHASDDIRSPPRGPASWQARIATEQAGLFLQDSRHALDHIVHISIRQVGR